MSRITRSLFLTSLLCGAFSVISATANAETFEELVKKAEPVEDLEPIISPFLQICGDSAKVEDLQCRAIKTRMQRKVQGRLYTFIAPSVEVGAYNGTKLNYPVKILGSLTAEKPVVLKWGLYGGKNKWHITATEPKRVRKKGGSLSILGIELKEHLASKKDNLVIPVSPSETEKWEKTKKKNLRVQFVFEYNGRTWPDKMTGNGIVVDLKGYRLYDQCKGEVLASSPRSTEKAPIVDAPSCRGPVSKVVEKASKEATVPEVLPSSTIRKVMQTANPAIKECHETYQISGSARVRITVQSDGTVTKSKVLGKFADTPTGKCILDKVQNLIFPRFKKSSMSFTYPFYLR